jgi:hypothetical protein
MTGSFAGGTHPRRARRLESVFAMLAGALASGALMVHVGFTATRGLLAGVLLLITSGFATVSERVHDGNA